MKQIKYLLLALLISSCAKVSYIEPEIPVIPEPTEDEVRVQFNLKAEEYEVITRSKDSDELSKINFFIFDKQCEVIFHVFTDDAKIETNLMPDTYMAVAVANYQYDLKDYGYEDLKGLSFSYSDIDEMEFSPLTYQGEIVIPKSANKVIVPTISLERVLAKIHFNINVADSHDNIEVVGVQLCNIPRYGRLLVDESLSDQRKELYFDSECVNINLKPGDQSYSNIIYMPENRQGVIDNITSIEERNMGNSPECATYLRIRAYCNKSIVDYFVFLGENNTNNFNIRNNTHNTINITIKGENQFDADVYSYNLTFNETGAEVFNYITTGSVIKGTIEVQTDSDIYDLSANLSFFSVDIKYVSVNGKSILSSSVDIPINADGNFEYTITYSPECFTPENKHLNYFVTVKDNFNYPSVNICQYMGVNTAQVHHFGIPERKCGTVSHNGVVLDSGGSDGWTWDLVAIPEQGVEIEAHPAAGYSFEGWYENDPSAEPISRENPFTILMLSEYNQNVIANFTQNTYRIYSDLSLTELDCSAPYEIDWENSCYIIPADTYCYIKGAKEGYTVDTWMIDGEPKKSYSNALSIIPNKNQHIIPFFQEPKRLDIEETSNCYIADSKYKTYCFDASNKGNNKWYDGLIALPNRFSSAKVLWETGDIKGGVIGDVTVEGNNLIFSTGDNYGNAVIGVFDDSDKVVWSWHIWFVEEQPKGVDLGESKIFLDRNLGAMGTGPNDYGLFYQWGRKDPFVADAFQKDAGSDSNTVNDKDFEWELNFIDEGVEYDYSVVNPTTLVNPLNNVLININWLKENNNLLWGDKLFSDADNLTSIKTYLDPCPPGYAVPSSNQIDNEAFNDLHYGKDRAVYFKSISDSNFCMPLGGYIYHCLENKKTEGNYWTNTSYSGGSSKDNNFGTTALFKVSNPDNISYVTTEGRKPKSTAANVRCVRPES